MAFTIPSTFTAIDKFSGPVRAMGSALARFGQTAKNVNSYIGMSESGLVRQQRLFNRLTPTLSEVSKQFLSVASSAAIAGGVLATLNYSKDRLIAYEDALASFRTIVSDLSDKEFANYRAAIRNVAIDTKKSTIDVAASFEKIAGLQAKFAETPKGLSKVSEAAIILAKASRDDLGTAAENLVGIMNQFSLGAESADRAINVLAAGQAAGAASISQTAQALQVFGAVAKSSNATIEQSVALIQVLASKQIQGSEAGTALRGAFVKLQKAGMGYKSGQFQINDALAQAKQKIDSLRTAKEKDAFTTKIFGMENLTAGKILLDNISDIKSFTTAVTGTSEAQKAAAINSNTLSAKWEEFKAKWDTIITSSDGAESAIGKVKNAISFLTDNMETILSVGGEILGFFIAWQALIWAGRAALFAYNVVQGVLIGLQNASTLTIAKNAVALGAYNVIMIASNAATWIATAATTAWGIAMNIGLMPLTLIIIAIVAFIAIIVAVCKHITGWGKQWEVITKFMKGIWEIFSLYLQLRWQQLKAAFMFFVEAIVLAWDWAQNKMGALSDAAYAKEKARIKQNQIDRVNAIAKTNEALIKAQNDRAKLTWELGWQNANEQEQGKASIANPKAAQANAIANSVQTINENSSVDVNVSASQGSTAEITRNTGATPVSLKPNVGSWYKK